MGRKILIGLVVLVTIAVAYLLVVRESANPKVIAEVENDPSGARANKVLVIDFPSGRRLPVNYLLEPPKVYVGVDGRWWRDFRSEPIAVDLLIKGVSLRATGQAVLDNQAHTDAVFARLRPKAPAWLPDWLNGKLVEFTLAPDQTLPEPNVGAHDLP